MNNWLLLYIINIWPLFNAFNFDIFFEEVNPSWLIEVHFFLRYSRLYRTVIKQGQSMEIYIFCETQWRWPWYVESTLMNIVYNNILFAILPFWISKENAAWCWLVTLGSSSLDRNHLNFGNLFAAFSF